MFHEHGMKRLPVVDADGRLVGIVSRSDVLSVYLRSDTEILHEVRDDILRDRLWIDPGSVQVTVHNGIVTLDGRLDRKSSVSIADRVIRRVAGVISVENHLREVAFVFPAPCTGTAALLDRRGPTPIPPDVGTRTRLPVAVTGAPPQCGQCGAIAGRDIVRRRAGSSNQNEVIKPSLAGPSKRDPS
jgi:CBS domain-containing protein